MVKRTRTITKYDLTHYQTTNFRLFQTERVCRRQFQIWRKWQKVIQMGRKHWEKEKLLVMSNFSFSPSVFKRLVSKGHQMVLLCGNGLILPPVLWQKLVFSTQMDTSDKNQWTHGQTDGLIPAYTQNICFAEVEKGKMQVTSIFSPFYNHFKTLLPKRCKNPRSCGRGLKNPNKFMRISET